MAIDKIQSESINLADTFAFTGTVTGAGGATTPAFYAQGASDQGWSDDATAKIIFGTEVYDTDNTFASSRFTPGVAGTWGAYKIIT